MKNHLLQWSLLAWVQFTFIAADSTLPYNPTRILTSPNGSYAYILGGSGGKLQVLDLTTPVTSANTFSPTSEYDLPFLSTRDTAPYLPLLEPSGNIAVIVGDCTAGAGSTEIWQWARDKNNQDADGSWSTIPTSARALNSNTNLTGVNYLSSGAVFSADVGNDVDDLDFYMFGGMCPFPNTTTDTWQAAANYSSLMLAYAPSDAHVDGQVPYEISSVAARGPPIAEAGYTMTGLKPTFRVNANGQTQSQQQDFLLLGGHTVDAFLNTSQVALFSLPQESWSFLPVQQPDGRSRNDLAARQADDMTVEPRSGHTAVLSEDGSKIFVLGGWVGDVSNPAHPQLAILHLGSEYGGDEAEAWTWSVPAPSGKGLASGTGLYGHGAAMLPGGIMMVVGGTTISASTSRFRKRQTNANAGILLFDTNSNDWVDSYTKPSPAVSGAEGESGKPSSDEMRSRKSQQTGLGVGLGIGVLVLVALILFYYWYMRRLKSKREERERVLLASSSDGALMTGEQPFLHARSIHNHPSDESYSAILDDHPQMTQAGSTGLFVNVPSPTRGLRKGLASRPYMYHQAPRYDDRRAQQGSGDIHPILEHHEEDDPDTPQTPIPHAYAPVHESDLPYDSYTSAEAKLRELQRVLYSGLPSPSRDPFADPLPNPLGSHPAPPSPGDTVRRVPAHLSHAESPIRMNFGPDIEDSRNWHIVEPDDHDEGAPSEPSAGPSMSSGRGSPTKTDERTSSTLSERSTQSHASTNSITRTMSTRTGAVLAAALARKESDHAPTAAPGEPRTATMSTTGSSNGRKSPYYYYNAYSELKREHRTPERHGSRHTADRSTDSFTTAHSRDSFIALQDEGKALLGGPPLMDRDDPYQRALAATGSPLSTAPKSEAEASMAPYRRQGWVGSIRRALTAISTDRSFSLTSQHKHPSSDHGPAPRGSSASPSRTRAKAGGRDGGGGGRGTTPRRAVSDGGALLRQKRGQKDWPASPHAPYRDDPVLDGDWGDAPRTSCDNRDAEDEWDVEGAASGRDVQVMFTVPKARLRVVNADVERASMRSVSEGGVGGRGGELVSIGVQGERDGGGGGGDRGYGDLSRGGSVNTLRSRSGGDVEGRERMMMMMMGDRERREVRERESRNFLINMREHMRDVSDEKKVV